jgi:excinuclease ABC subunit B
MRANDKGAMLAAMREAAKMLEFELAASLRDQIIQLRGK